MRKGITVSDELFTVLIDSNIMRLSAGEKYACMHVDDYVRNLRTALNQTFKPMDIRFSEDEERKVTLAYFI